MGLCGKQKMGCTFSLQQSLIQMLLYAFYFCLSYNFNLTFYAINFLPFKESGRIEAFQKNDGKQYSCIHFICFEFIIGMFSFI